MKVQCHASQDPSATVRTNHLWKGWYPCQTGAGSYIWNGSQRVFSHDMKEVGPEITGSTNDEDDDSASLEDEAVSDKHIF